MKEKISATYAARIDRLRALLRKNDFDAAIVRTAPNRVYLSGFESSYAIVIVDATEAIVITDGRYAEAAERELPGFRVLVQPTTKIREFLKDFAAKHAYKRAAIEGGITVADLEGMKKWMRGTKLVVDDEMLSGLRRVKDEEEIRAIAASVRTGDRVMEAALELISPGMTERELSRQIRILTEELGATKESFENIVASGPNSSSPHHHPGTRKFRVGDPVTVDLGVIKNGYCSDLTRTPVIGRVDPEFERIYNVCLEANQAAIRGLTPGMTGAEVDALARDIVSAAGYGEYFNHGTGHGVGIEIHESPRLSPSASAYKLEPGNIVTVEPGIYLPGKFGVRIEDYILITEKGAKVLSRLPRQLRVLPAK